MRSKVQRWGNSLAVRIPKTFAEEVGLADDSPIEIRLVKGGLLLEPSAEYRYELEELVAGIDDANAHREADYGEAVGGEAW